MKFLKLEADGRTIDRTSFAQYVTHLDAIRDCLPTPLYSMLRYPEEAYKKNKTFDDALLLEWRDVMDLETWKARAEIRILDSAGKHMGDLHCRGVRLPAAVDDRGIRSIAAQSRHTDAS